MAKKLALVNGVPRMVDESASPTIYNETLAIDSTIATGTPVTLPNEGTYDSEELEVRLNGQRLESGIDYNYVDSPPRTQVTFTFDLLDGDDVNFRVDRGP